MPTSNCHPSTLGARQAWLSLALLLALLTLGSPSQAQRSPDAEEQRLTSFMEKQEAMLALMDQQMPLLARLQQQADKVKGEVMQQSELLASSANIDRYRQRATTELVQLRKQADRLEEQMLKLNFAWFPHERDLMAVYTRYGELMARDKVDASLKEFLIGYRAWMQEVERLNQTLKDAYNEADFLLNSKLN